MNLKMKKVILEPKFGDAIGDAMLEAAFYCLSKKTDVDLIFNDKVYTYVYESDEAKQAEKFIYKAKSDGAA
jgi:hypothetical protein